MIQGLWDRQAEAIIDVKLGDSDAYLYRFEPTVALLAQWDKIKKDKHGKHCHNQRKHLPVCSFCQWYARGTVES